jgi:hypothetical protein
MIPKDFLLNDNETYYKIHEGHNLVLIWLNGGYSNSSKSVAEIYAILDKQEVENGID